MSKSRNERRKAAQARLNAKLERLAKAELGRQADERRLIVKGNLQGARPERNLYPQSCLASMAGNSHRGYVCRAGGSMDRRRALALKARGSW